MPPATEDDDSQPTDRPSNKVARLISEYELGSDFGDWLEQQWTSNGEQRQSLRSLADTFNERLLEVAIAEAGASTLDGEVSNLYRLLTGDEVSSGQRVEARNRLQQEGVDVEGLETDFVTYQAIRSYLKEYRGAEYDGPSEEDRIDNTTETVQRLISRTRSVVENSLDRLRRTSTIALGEYRVFVDINVLCEECSSQYGIVELLNRGGCDCAENQTERS